MVDDYEEEAFCCSFCKERFRDVIKLIPECGNNVCGQCYEHLRYDVDEETGMYLCVACMQGHKLSWSGLCDNKELFQIFKKLEDNLKSEKSLSENALKLKLQMKEMKATIAKLETFDGEEFVQAECERLEMEVSEVIESAIRHLSEIEKSIMRKIDKYRLNCLEKLGVDSRSKEKRARELTSLTNKLNRFNSRWKKYFTHNDANETESEIETALEVSNEYLTEMNAFADRLRKQALNEQTLVFKVNIEFFDKFDFLGIIEDIAEHSDRKGTESFGDFENTQESLNGITIQTLPSVSFDGHSGEINQILLLKNGRLASCSEDKSIKIWNIETRKEMSTLEGHTSRVNSLAFLPNGQLASGSSDHTIKIWDLVELKEIRTMKGHTSSILGLKALKNGNLASYSTDDTIKIWDFETGILIFTLKGHGNTEWLIPFGILSTGLLVTCSRDPRLIRDKKHCMLRLWNSNGQLVKSISTNLTDVRSLYVLSNDQVAVGFTSGTLMIIDPNQDESGTRIKEKAHNEDIYSFVQLSNSNLISCGRDSPTSIRIKVWNLLNMSLLQAFDSTHIDVISSLCVSADEKFLATASFDKRIKLFALISSNNSMYYF